MLKVYALVTVMVFAATLIMFLAVTLGRVVLHVLHRIVETFFILMHLKARRLEQGSS